MPESDDDRGRPVEPAEPPPARAAVPARGRTRLPLIAIAAAIGIGVATGEDGSDDRNPLRVPTRVRTLDPDAELGDLEIHYINVGQGGCTLIVGPDGTTILYDFGPRNGSAIAAYLQDQAGIHPQQGLDYTMVSHRDKDHYMGYREVVQAGYDVHVANFDSGSTKTSKTIEKNWLQWAEGTAAGAVRPIPVGLHIPLGDGAEALVVAASGQVLGLQEPVEIENENDKSIALLVTYKGFQYLLDGDLGGGPEDCTEHDDMDQVDVQTVVANSLLAQGLLDPVSGVDVLHISHHGSESSTPARYYNLVRPEVGLVSVGLKQGGFLHPRVDVVDRVLLDTQLRATDCLAAPPLTALFQTESGKPGTSSTGTTSFSGNPVGDIQLTTDGESFIRVRGTGRVHPETDVGDVGVKVFALD